MMRRLLLLLLLISFSFGQSFEKSNFVLNHVETDFGYGCQYYDVINAQPLDVQLASPTSIIASKTTDVKNAEWEVLATIEKSRVVHNYKWVCDEGLSENGSMVQENCTDKGTDKIEYYWIDEWLPMDATHTFSKSKTTHLRYCAEFDMKPLPEGGWGVRIDVVPSFAGFSYPEYAWWNSSWDKCMQINISGSHPANFSHMIYLNSSFNYSNAQSDLDDLRAFEGTCNAPNTTIGQLGIWNETVAENDSRIWILTDSANASSIALYYNNSGAPSAFNITEAFVWGRDKNNCQQNWTNHSNVLMRTDGDYCWIDINNPGSADEGYYTLPNIPAPFEWEINMNSSLGAGTQAATIILDGSASHRFIQLMSPLNNNLDAYKGYANGSWTDHVILDGIASASTFWIVKSQTNGSHCRYFMYNQSHDLEGSVGWGTDYGSPTAADRIRWNDGSSSSYYDNVHFSRQFIRNMNLDMSEPTYTFGSEESYPGLEISACQDLNVSTTYILTQNISTNATCFTLSVNDVTLNCDGYTITGDGGTDERAISIYNDDNILVENCRIRNFSQGIRVWDSDNATIQNTTLYDLPDPGGSYDGLGFDILGTANNTLITNVTIYDAEFAGIWLVADSINVTDTEIYNSTRGFYITDNDDEDIRLTDVHLYDNTLDFVVNNTGTGNCYIYSTNLIFDIAAGDYTNYTNLSMNDTVGVNDIYTMDYASEPASLPDDLGSLSMFLNISEVSGSPQLGTVVWHYLDGDVPSDIAESTLDMWAYNGTWSEISDTLDASANTLTVSSLEPETIYAPLGDQYLSINVTLNDTNETVNETMIVTLNANGGNMTAYEALVYYNNTLMLNSTASGINNASINLTTPVVAPLVDSNSTNISWEIQANITVEGSDYSDDEYGNQSVNVHYDINDYNLTKDANYTIEAVNNFTVAFPTKPASSPANVSYASGPYNFSNCMKHYANGTDTNTTCTSSLLSVTNVTHFSILPSHLQENGLIYMDYWVNRSYVLSFNATDESTSSKTISDEVNTTREYFVWLVNFTNGTIDGADNMSDVFNVTFYDEDTLASLNITSSVASYTVTFSDASTKNFSVSYSGTVTNHTVRGYPDFYTANVSSVEVYSKTNYTTRSRFMVYASTDLSVLQNISVYLLPDSEATYAIINVVDNGNEVAGATVKIHRYYAASGLYTLIEEKVTNSDGRAAAFLDVDSYFRFIVYDTEGTLVYTSSGPEQFICDTQCEITINIGSSSAIDWGMPSPVGTCYGNATGNSLVFTYSDYTGKTETVNFLAWRSNGSTGTPVCNNTVTSSSTSWVCTLSGAENVSVYPYFCTARYTASPTKTAYEVIVDLVTPDSVTDWLFVAIFMVMGMGAAFVMSPIVGIVAMTVGVAMMHYFDVAPINQTFVIYLVLTAGMLIFFWAKGDEH